MLKTVDSIVDIRTKLYLNVRIAYSVCHNLGPFDYFDPEKCVLCDCRVVVAARFVKHQLLGTQMEGFRNFYCEGAFRLNL